MPEDGTFFCLGEPEVTVQLPDVPHDRLCHARQILDRVGDKWSISVIYTLGAETKRFTELLRAIDGISQRMLTSTLRALERDGIVERTVHPVVPPRVDYRLTELGLTLSGTVCALMRWAVDHAAEIDEARAGYDHRAGLVEVTGPVTAPAHPR
jgi:DNA-binding HxlR family transcriptional regulator